MAKLSILIEDSDYTALKRKALDNGIRFQPWVRATVLGLLGQGVEKTTPQADEKVLRSLLQIRERAPVIEELLRSLIHKMAEECDRASGAIKERQSAAFSQAADFIDENTRGGKAAGKPKVG